MSKSRRSAGEGTVWQRTDGRWQAAIQLDGKRRSVYDKTRAEASERLEALKRQVHVAGLVPTLDKTTVNELLDAWWRSKLRRSSRAL